MNRKKRNLQFIRTKNNLRKGKCSFCCYEKVSNKLSGTVESIENLKAIAMKSLLKNYKLKINYFLFFSIEFLNSQEGDDFSKNTNTHLIKIKLVDSYERR